MQHSHRTATETRHCNGDHKKEFIASVPPGDDSQRRCSEAAQQRPPASSALADDVLSANRLGLQNPAPSCPDLRRADSFRAARRTDDRSGLSSPAVDSPVSAAPYSITQIPANSTFFATSAYLSPFAGRLIPASSTPNMVNIPLCQIWMVSSVDVGKLFLKVERGSKPRLKLYEDARKAHVTIPSDQSTKWPPLRATMSGGLTVVVQRLEQQYKITVQHFLERKPDVCVYVNAMAHERDVKTSVREMNTQLKHVGIAGPNLEVTGRIKGVKVTFESTVGALHTNAKLVARSVTLNAQHIFVKPEAMFSCAKIRMVSRRVQIDGKIYPWECEPDYMSVSVDSSLLHIGVDGVIGSIRTFKEKSASSKSPEILVNVLSFRLSGCLANFGRIASKCEMEFYVEGSVLSLKDGHIDSATRGYTALKQIKGVVSEASSSLPTSSTLSSAILSQKPDAVAQLLEDGVDPNDSIRIEDPGTVLQPQVEFSRSTPRKIAARKYREVRDAERRNKLREKIMLIQALMSAHDWRRGLITSGVVIANIGRDCGDCAQFRATTLILTTQRSAKCEAGSIWSCGSVTLTVGCDLIFEGQVKHQHLDASCGGSVMTTEEGIVSQECWAKITASAFRCAGIWSVGEQMSLEVITATFLADSYIEVDLLDGKVEESCHHGGTWQTRFLSISLGGSIVTLHNGKVLVDETASITAGTFNCSGVWKIAESVQINLKGSANVFPPGRVSAKVLKMTVEGHCTVAGHVNAEHLLAYVRNDLITASTGRVTLGVGGTVAAGAFRNDASWVSERNLQVHTACFEQSEDAMILAKDTLNLVIYDDSIERSQGRIFANYCIFRIGKRVRFDGYIRVNQIEIVLPFVNESRCTIGGQLEVLEGPLVLKGRSDFSGSPSFSAHISPAFVLEGQLRAEAVISPFLATRFATSSYALLSGMDSIAAAPYRTFISTGALYTMHASLIDSVSADTFPEAIICSTTWVHEGQVRFRGDSAYLITDSFVNRGRLTNDGKLHNHMKEVFVSIANHFRNDAVLSADRIHISGDGELENKNRIFATDAMNIRLANFCNEAGHMQSENMKLLSAGKEWTKIDGRIEAKGNLDISASKLCMAVKRFDMHKQVRISARSQLLVSSDVVDETANIALAARDAIVFDARCELDHLELAVGASYETEIVINEGRLLKANQLRIAGRCKFLRIVIDGELLCGSIVVEETIKNVKIIGRGSLTCRRSFNTAGETAFFGVAEIQAVEILGSSLTLSPSTMNSKVVPAEEANALTLYADNCFVHGQLLVEGKMNVKANRGTVHIDGEVIGTTVESELSVECDDFVLSKHLSNFDFLEIYARKRIEYCETATTKNLRSAAMEAEFIALHGNFVNCDGVVATADEVVIEGSLQGNSKTSSCSIFAKTIRFHGSATGLTRFEFNGGSDVLLAGTFSHIDAVDIDAKWISYQAEATACGAFSITSFSAFLAGSFGAESVTVNCVGAILNCCDMQAPFCSLCAPFVLCACAECSLPSSCAVSALVFLTDRVTTVVMPDRVCTKISFEPEGSDVMSAQQVDTWKAAVQWLHDSFRSQTVNLDEALATLRSNLDAPSEEFCLPSTSQLYEEVKKIFKKFQIEHISVFSCSKLINLMRDYEANLIASTIDDEICGKSEQRRFWAESMHELANRFRVRAKKYTPQSPRLSGDDGGYASRSSSEDIDEKHTKVESPTPLIDVERVESPTKLANEACDDIEREIHEEARSFAAIRVAHASSDEELRCSELCCAEHELEAENETGFVLNGDRKVPIERIDFQRLDVVILKPRIDTPRRTPSTADLAMKKIRVKAAMSNLDLRSFGSESSLASFDTAPLRLQPSPLKRSLIPRSSRRRAFTPA